MIKYAENSLKSMILALNFMKIDDFWWNLNLKKHQKIMKKRCFLHIFIIFWRYFHHFHSIEISWNNPNNHQKWWFLAKIHDFHQIAMPRTRLWDSLQPLALHSWFKQIIKLRHSWLDSAYGPASSLISLIKFAQLLNEI